MNPSRNLFLIGPTGAGKTSLGRRLAAHYGLALVDLDREIERRTGTGIATIFDLEGESGFRRRESALLADHVARDNVLIATGAGAVLDAGNRAQLVAHGYVLWVQVDIEQQLERLARDGARPLLAGADRHAALAAMAAIRDPLYQACADLALPAIHGTTAMGNQAIALLDNHWQRPPAPISTATA